MHNGYNAKTTDNIIRRKLCKKKKKTSITHLDDRQFIFPPYNKKLEKTMRKNLLQF